MRPGTPDTEPTSPTSEDYLSSDDFYDLHRARSRRTLEYRARLPHHANATHVDPAEDVVPEILRREVRRQLVVEHLQRAPDMPAQPNPVPEHRTLNPPPELPRLPSKQEGLKNNLCNC